jgi:hypothetical protein
MDSSDGNSATEGMKELNISAPAPLSRSSSSSSTHKPGHIPNHRQSFAENLRGMPPSPRAQRHPSFTQAAVQELMNNPPAPKPHNPRFAGRDWRDVQVGELTTHDDLKWVTLDTSVEDATMVR